MKTVNTDTIPPIPVRMLNEYVYCPRLAHLMWVQGEFAHSADTVEGAVRHQRVDKASGKLPAEGEDMPEQLHARSVYLTSESLGITAKIDVVEGDGEGVMPVDYKKGKRPHIAAGAYAPERVQVCAQGLLLRDHGFRCDEGVLYFIGSKERVPVLMDEALIRQTLDAIDAMKKIGGDGPMPPPLEDSPKCGGCSLIGICLPDEVRFMQHLSSQPRPVIAGMEKGLPLYVQSPRAFLRKEGEEIIVEEKKEKIAHARLKDTSQIVLYGSTGVSTPLLHECMSREIPVTFLSYGGWFMGHMVGSGHKNVETRTCQYRASFDPIACLKLSKLWVAAKIANCRTLIRRNWKVAQGEEGPPGDLLREFRNDISAAMRAGSLDQLLGIEGNSARRYFQNFTRLFSKRDEAVAGFDFTGRNRRPPKDPVNALLSFSYSMLTREWVVALSAVGLDPYRGFFHQSRFGRPALALDMMEPFRPLVADSTVMMVINNGEVKVDDFVVSAVGCNLKSGGRRQFIAAFDRRMEQEITHPIFKYRVSYRRLFEVQARLLVRFLSGEISRYPNFITR